jgi:glutamine amidotransferase
MHSGEHPVSAQFWLLDASDSLVVQSRLQPDGAGIGTFDDDGCAEVDKQPIAAWQDEQFAAEARAETSRTFVAHVRHASTGDLRPTNTHPFVQANRLFAHNGVVEDLPKLEQAVGERWMREVAGDTDSERVFALISRCIEERHGDVDAGIRAAVEWMAANLPIYACNFILGTQDTVWALRWPHTHELHVLERKPGGNAAGPDADLAARGTEGRLNLHVNHTTDRPVVVLASEAMDADPGWWQLAPGELLKVGPDLIPRREVITGDPVRLLTDADLDAEVAASQRVR